MLLHLKFARCWIAASLACMMNIAPAQAGQDCQDRGPTVATVTQGMALAARVARALDASGARVVVLGRAGQDLSAYGLRYSHLGWAYQSADGAWRVLHKLNTCGTARSLVMRQGLGEFFLDGLWRYEAVWAVPSPQVQAALLPGLQNPQRTAWLHEPAYSLVSYAWGQRYQQSNQ